MSAEFVLDAELTQQSDFRLQLLCSGLVADKDQSAFILQQRCDCDAAPRCANNGDFFAVYLHNVHDSSTPISSSGGFTAP
jgi:hypothetical protein